MKKINRFYNQNFEDEYKQQAMNLLLHGMNGHINQDSDVDFFMKSR